MANRRILLTALPALLAPWRAKADYVYTTGSGGAGAINVATTGSASVTGVATETSLAALRVPANAMGLNGTLVVNALFSFTNSSNNKTLLGRFTATAGATSGGQIGVLVATTTATAQLLFVVRNNNAVASQNSYVIPNTPFGSTTNAVAATTVNTAADAYFNLNGTLAVTTETVTLVHAIMTIYQF